jgi:hypothetical protein
MKSVVRRECHAAVLMLRDPYTLGNISKELMPESI